MVTGTKSSDTLPAKLLDNFAVSEKNKLLDTLSSMALVEFLNELLSETLPPKGRIELLMSKIQFDMSVSFVTKNSSGSPKNLMGKIEKKIETDQQLSGPKKCSAKQLLSRFINYLNGIVLIILKQSCNSASLETKKSYWYQASLAVQIKLYYKSSIKNDLEYNHHLVLLLSVVENNQHHH